MKQINEEIRKIKFKERQNCYICDRYKDITEAHHLIEVSDISKYIEIIQSDIQFYESLRGVWLCPNHHTIYHKIYSNKGGKICTELNEREKDDYINLYKYAQTEYNKLTQEIENSLKISNKDKALKYEVISIIKKKINKIQKGMKVLELKKQVN